MLSSLRILPHRFLRVFLSLFAISGITPYTLAQDSQPLTSVRVIGLEGMAEAALLERLGGRLDFITSRPPSPSRANDAEFMVRSLLIKEGFSDLETSWRIPPSNQVIELTIHRSKRAVLGTINIIGASDELNEVLSKYFTGTSLLGGQTETPYLEDDVAIAAQNTVTHLQSQGYWKATSKLDPPIRNLKNNTVDLTLRVQLGQRHTISRIPMTGSPLPADTGLPSLIQSYIGKVATASTLREISEGTTARLRGLGYQFAQSTLSAKHLDGQTLLDLNLDLGERYQLRKAQLTGAPKTDYRRAQKLLNRLTGQPYHEAATTKFRNSLLATGAFDSIKQDRTVDSTQQAIDLTLHLTEGRAKGISYYAGAGSLEGFIVGASYFDRNFLSSLYNFNVAAEFSGIGFLGEISVTDPFLFGRNLRATPRAFLLSRTYDEYRKLEAGVGFTLSTHLGKNQTLEFDALFSFATVEGEELPTAALGATDYLLSTVGATWIFDTRDSSVSPSKGLFTKVKAEFGAVAADPANAFFRLDGQLAYHLRLNETSRLGFNAATGILSPTDQTSLPVDLRYFIGGADSVRSFAARQLGPLTNGTPRGGQSFWYTNIEYIRKIAGPLYGVAFLDAGSLDESAASWPSFEPKLAAGFGLRLDLPIGPVRLEYGRSLNPAPEDPDGAFHFSIGASF